MNKDLDIAAQTILDGNLVAFPTETVFGLGADATNNTACTKIFTLKNRPSVNPLIVHVDNKASAEKFAVLDTDKGEKLIEAFWPGPLTIVVPLKENSNIAPSVLGENNTVAIRMPSHNIALELIRRSGRPIAAPSANPSGYISSTSSAHVLRHFAKNDVFIVAANSCKYGLESTIVDLTTPMITILRHGFITAEAIEKVLGEHVGVHDENLDIIKSPGMLNKHYSPYVKVRLNAGFLSENEIGLNLGDSELLSNYSLNLSRCGNLIEAAANLYKMLRELDDYASIRNNTIAIAKIPEYGIGVAINDRIKRAASST
ncbi:MAG: L-threonylcarbamoyladenylate synthase [Janthinobacterium lividum]